ncbi:MAG TPA: hypothetical protein VGD99_23400 [Anaerolineae bacterium]
MKAKNINRRKIAQAVGLALWVWMLVTWFGYLGVPVSAQQGEEGEPVPAETPAPPDAPLPDDTQTQESTTSPDLDRETLLRQTAHDVFAGQTVPEQEFEVGLTKIVADWAFVNYRLKAANEEEAVWDIQLGLGRWDGSNWTIALEGSDEFLIWLDQIPDELISHEARPYLDPGASISANAPGLWLPFPVGQTWRFLAGPHGSPSRAMVDFGPFNLRDRVTPNPPPTSPLTGYERDVTAADTGVVVDRDANLIILRHQSNPTLETGYFSLAAASNTRPIGQTVYQGERLGAASNELNPAGDDRVYFWIRRDSIGQAIDGQVLSEWRIHQDNGLSVGQNAGRIIYKTGPEKIDCLTVEQFHLIPDYCHIKHFSIEPDPLPTTTVRLEPMSVITIPLARMGSARVVVENVSNLHRVQVRLSYSPSLSLTVVDAFTHTPAIEVAPGSIFQDRPFAIIQNEADPQTGIIDFVAALQVPAPVFSGTGSIITVTWRGNITGTVQVRLDEVLLEDPNGRSLQAVITPTISQIVIAASDVVLQGQVELQGRTDWSGVSVTTVEQQSQTTADGTFRIAVGETNRLTVRAPGYLSAQADGDFVSLEALNSKTINLGRVRLLGGEVTGDDRIDIFDLALIGSRYGSRDPKTDINGDGVTNLFDLVLTAANYDRRGPITDWQ